MKIPIQYLNDEKGNIKAVQLPIDEWEKILNKLKKYEQALVLKSQIKDAIEQMSTLMSSRKRKQNLKEFLNDL